MKQSRTALSSAITFIALAGTVQAQETFPTGPYPQEMNYLMDRWDATVRIEGDAALGLIRAVEVVVSDQVDGGCWTNVGAVQARVRSELERSGIAVFTEPMAIYNILSPQVRIDILGYKAGNGLCIGHAEMSVSFLADDEMGSLGYTKSIFRIVAEAVVWERAAIFSGALLNDQVMEKVQEWTDTLLADASAAKRDETVRDFLNAWNSELPRTQTQQEQANQKILQEIEGDR